MTRRSAAATATLVVACLSALSSAVAGPLPGLWEVTSSREGGPRTQAPVTDQRCLTDQAAATGFDSFFVTPQSDGKSGAPTCQMNDLTTDDKGSAWKMRCDGSGAKASGTGTSSFTEGTYQAEQSMAASMLLIKMQMTTKTIAKRLGSC